MKINVLLTIVPLLCEVYLTSAKQSTFVGTSYTRRYKGSNLNGKDNCVPVDDNPDLRQRVLTRKDFRVTLDKAHCIYEGDTDKCLGKESSGLDKELSSTHSCKHGLLSCYRSGCISVHNSRKPDCMDAMHRFCSNTGKGDAAYPQEVGIDEFGLVCAKASWYGEVAYSNIPNCVGKTQSAECFSSTHHYCDATGHGGAGIIQELGVGVVGLACVPTPWYHVVKVAELAKLHNGCNSPAKAQESPCLAAAHRYYSNRGLGIGGVISELGRDEVTLGCITDGTYTAAKVV